ncbi:NAD(P)-dependent oxidoreductase, partial [Candidatus Saganbacteria bacterium CG08_land_8_20_14_0_20_45_16]
MTKIFITGITGCVGHYIFDLLVKNPDYELYLLVRDPARMMRDLSAFSNVKVIKGEMRDLEKQADLLRQMDCVVHLAAGWGETEANYEYTLDLFKLLDPQRVKKIIYFSTASLLGNDNQVQSIMGEIGTSYIKGKYMCHQELSKLAVSDKIITLYPTWVLGGDKAHPYSHALQGIISLKKWLWLLRFFSFEVSFHFIHAADIAAIVDHLLKSEVKEQEFVLGNELISAQELIKQVCVFFHQPVCFQVNIPASLVKLLAGRRFSDWDKYCLSRKSFDYKVVNPENFGLKRAFPTI